MSPRIGVACPRSGERAAFSNWLLEAGLEPVMLVDACFVKTDVAGDGLQCVVADASVLTKEAIASFRRVDAGLPIIAVGDPGDAAEEQLACKHVPFYGRPVDQAALMLAVSLAVAEGRPARRSLRRLVPRLPTSINGAPAFLIDVSGEGLRLEVPRAHGARLGPQFHVQVPMFNRGVTVRRVWVKSESPATDQPRVQCGASLIEADQRAMRAWGALVEATAGAHILSRARPAPAKVGAARFLGRVTQMLGDAPLVGSLAHLPWRHGGRS
jgi:hypothetical protein